MSLERARRYWSGVFGLTAEAFAHPGIQLVTHKEGGGGYHDFSSYHALYALRRGASLIVSVPAALHGAAQERLGAHKTMPSFEELRALFGDWTQRSVGPAFQGYLEPNAFRPVTGHECRALSPEDHRALEQLKAACDPVAWSHSGLSVEDRDLSGCFAGGRLVAAAKLILWAEGVFNPGLITHPAFRGLGYGAGALSCAAQTALNRKDLLVYQTLSSNQAAVKLAQTLGFGRFGESFVLHLPS